MIVFPLPIINQLVDAITWHEIMNFLDTFSGHNQILMHPSDQQKTSFMMESGTYGYKVMPFELKNAEAMYQRLINWILKDLIRKMMEFYIENMLIKCLMTEDHLEHLKLTFELMEYIKWNWSDKHHVPSNELTFVSSPWSFIQWGMDIVRYLR